MSLFSKFKTELKKSLSKPETSGLKQSFGSIDYTIPQIPCIVEKKNDPWVWYGEDNLYPLKISDLRAGSGIHNSIVNIKSKMVAGDGWLYNGAKTKEESDNIYNSMQGNVKTEIDLFLKNPNNQENLQAIKDKCADDLMTHGACAYEIVYNMDFTKIVRIKYVNVENVRSGKIENDEVKEYWFSRDWPTWGKRRSGEFKPTQMFAFDTQDKEHMNQLVYIKLGKNDYYGDVPYKGCLNWIMIDFKMGLFHLSNIDNGMNPGIWFKYYKLPADENQKQEILNNLKRTYQGATKTNKMVVTFSEGKELAPDIQPIQASNLDKQLLLLAELSDKKILTGHQWTSPLLAGISVSGQLGANQEIEKTYLILDNTYMQPYRNMMDASFQKILDFNKVPVQLETNPFNPFKTRV